MITNFFKVERQKDDFSLRMEILRDCFKNSRIIVYGLGEETKILLKEYGFDKLDIAAVSDTDIKEQGSWGDYKLIPPLQIKDCDFDYILIMQDNLQRAKRYLQCDLGIEEVKIVNVLRTEFPDEAVHIDYLKKICFEKQFDKLVKKLKDHSIVIYGANPFLQAVARYVNLSRLNVIAVCDMKFKMHKQTGEEKFFGYNICSTSELADLSPDFVLVAEKYFDNEMMEHLFFTSLKGTGIKILPLVKKPLCKTIADILKQKNIITDKEIPIHIKAQRVVNLLTNRVASKVQYNTSKPYKMPIAARIDACTLCQLDCKSCYMRKYDHSAIGDGWLKFEKFKTFVDQNPAIKRVSIANSGEIFLNPDLVKILEYAFAQGVVLDAMTGVNLNTLSDETAEALVKYQFEYLNISIDGASQETYSQYRKKGNYEQVIENIKKINYYKEKYNSELPKMKWKFILFNHNECDILKAKETAKALNMSISFALPWGNSTYMPKDEEFVKRETGLKFASVKEKQETTKTKYRLNLCARAFSAPQINFDGKLLGCCILFREHYGINVFENGFEKALNSAEFQYTIKMIRGEVHPLDSIPCTACTEYNALTYNNEYYD